MIFYYLPIKKYSSKFLIAKIDHSFDKEKFILKQLKNYYDMEVIGKTFKYIKISK